MSKPIQMERGIKYRDADKMALIPVKTGIRDDRTITQTKLDENQTSG